MKLKRNLQCSVDNTLNLVHDVVLSKQMVHVPKYEHCKDKVYVHCKEKVQVPKFIHCKDKVHVINVYIVKIRFMYLICTL